MRTSKTLSLVLLPGMHGTDDLFLPFVQCLPENWSSQVIQFPPQEVLGYRELIPFVRERLPTDEPFVLLAESFSGPLALKLAADPPPNLRALVLVVTFLRRPIRPLPRWIGKWAARYTHVTPPNLLLRLIVLGLSATDAAQATAIHAVGKTAPHVLSARIHEALTVDVTSEYQTCPVPLLVLNARHDRLIGRPARREFRRQRGDVKVVELDGPHLLLYQSPAACRKEIEEFLDSLPE